MALGEAYLKDKIIEKENRIEQLELKSHELIEAIIDKHPNMQMPEDEELYFAIHNLKKEINY